MVRWGSGVRPKVPRKKETERERERETRPDPLLLLFSADGSSDCDDSCGDGVRMNTAAMPFAARLSVLLLPVLLLLVSVSTVATAIGCRCFGVPTCLESRALKRHGQFFAGVDACRGGEGTGGSEMNFRKPVAW